LCREKTFGEKLIPHFEEKFFWGKVVWGKVIWGKVVWGKVVWGNVVWGIGVVPKMYKLYFSKKVFLPSKFM
jgi:hypothetical protein